MTRRRKRKCLNWRQLLDPDPRNRRHQRYCRAPSCRKASKAASQRRWLRKPGNRDYFRGPSHAQRVRDWRAAHPDYRPRQSPLEVSVLQDLSSGKPLENQADNPTLAPPVLQELLQAQPLVLAGLIAQLTGETLQDVMPHAA